MNKKLEEIFDECRRVWGLDAQIIQLAEESSELSVSALHMLRANTGKDDIQSRQDALAEEIADVTLMVEEISYYYDIEGDVLRIREQKIKRLKKRLGIKC